MRLGSMTVAVDGDLSSLEKSLRDAKGKALAAGQDMSEAIGQGLSKAKEHLLKLEQDTEEFLKRHKGKIALAAAATAGIWAYNNPDDAKRYYNQVTDAATNAAGRIKTGFSDAYASITSESEDFSARAKAAIGDIGNATSRAAGDILGSFGKAGEEAGKYFAEKLLNSVGDYSLKLGEKAASTAADLGKLSHFTGQSVEQLSSLRHMAEQTGQSLEGLSATMLTLNGVISSESDAAKLARQQLEAVGISVKDSQGNLKTAEQLWVELADATRSWSDSGEDAAKKLGILQNILGSVDKEKLALLNEGGAANKARLEEAARIGAIYTKEMAENMQRLQAERKAEAAEEQAWAERKAIMWANLGADFKRLAHEVEWGQVKFVDAIGQAWDRIGTFVTEWIDYLKGYYQGFLTFMKDSLGAFGDNWVPQWLENAVKNGPGPRKVIPALSGRNADGSPDPGATPPGGIKPPSPIQPSGSPKGGKSSSDLEKYINSIAGAAMSEQAGFLGDKYGSQKLAAWKDYTSEIDSLRQKLEGFEGANKESLEAAGWYWATYRLGIKLAKADVEAVEASIAQWADNQSRMGELLGDPEKSLSGKFARLALEQKKAEREINASTILSEESRESMLADIRERYRLEDVKAREDSLGDAAKLDDEYWARRQQGLDAQLAFVKKNVTSEHAFRVYAAQQQDKLNQEYLQGRIGTEETFGAYFQDRLALNYGLYKSAQGQMLDDWQKWADSMIKGLDGIFDAFSWTFGQAMGDIVTGKFKDVGNYVSQLLAQLKQAFASFITDLAKIAMERYIKIPIIGSIMGTEGSLNLGSMGGLNVQGGDGFSLSNVAKYAGYGKDAYSLLSGGGAASYTPTGLGASLGVGADYSAMVGGTSWGATSGAGAASGWGAYSSGSMFTGTGVNYGAVTSATAPTAAGSGGLMSSIGPAAGAGTVGWLAGNTLRPDVPGIGYGAAAVGAGTALAATSSTVMGAVGMSALGALSATGVGAIAAIATAVIASLATPETKSYSWGVPKASQPAVWLVDGQAVPASYGVIKTSTSGMMGSSSTKHTAIYDLANPEISKQVLDGMNAASGGLKGLARQLGYTEDGLKETLKGVNSMMVAIPEGYEELVYHNLANLQAETFLKNTGAIAQVDALLKSGEDYITALTRMANALQVVESQSVATGFTIEQLAVGMDRITAGDYASRLIEAAGGAEALATSLARLNTYGYSAQEQMERSLTATATATGRSIAEIGDAGVTIENFWVKFREAIEAGMDPARMSAWVAASARMEQWEQVRRSWQQADIEAIQQQNSQLQAQISVVQQLSQAWEGFSDQLVRLKQSLLMDQSLSPLSPLEKMNQAKTYLDGLTAQARSGDTRHLADIDQATKDYLNAALDYYGATADYYAVFDATSATIDQLSALAGAQVSEAAQQIAQLQYQIEQGNAQIVALNTINQGVGEVVSAVNNVAGAIGGAIQSANAAQQAASIPQWAAMAVPADSAAVASPFSVPAETDGAANYRAILESMGWSVPQYASGGTNPGGWFVAGDDPSIAGSGELGWSAGPVRIFSNRKSRSILSGLSGGGSVDTSGIEARIEETNRRLDSVMELLALGNRDRRSGNQLSRSQLLEADGRRM